MGQMAVGSQAGVHQTGKVIYSHPSERSTSLREAEESGKETEASNNELTARRHAAAGRGSLGVSGRLPGLAPTSPYAQEKLAERQRRRRGQELSIQTAAARLSEFHTAHPL